MHGNHGEDPTEGHWSKQYPWPAVSHEPRIQEIADDLAAAGYHPFSAPCGILLDEADRPRSTCIRCTWCDGYPCLVHAKSDAETIAVRPLLMAPNVTLLVEAEVREARDRRQRPDASPASSCRGQGREEVYAADIVVVSAGASNSAKLLLRSANDRHPNGLANGSDQVGRNYMFHNSKAVVALAKERNDTVFQKTLGINDFYLGGTDDGWPLGNIQMVGKSNGWAMKGEEPKLTKLAPHWSLDEVAAHAVDFWLTTEDLPDPDNRVTVDGDGNVHLAYTSNNDDEADGLYHELKKILNHIGMAEHHVLGKNFYMKMNIPDRRLRPPGRHVPVRRRPGDVGARRELQGPRARQPLRRRHQLLPQHRRREPGAHGDGQRASGSASTSPNASADRHPSTHHSSGTENHMTTLTGKVAIVTGGNSGIGKAIVLALAEAGANIVIDYVANEQATEDLEKQVVGAG